MKVLELYSGIGGMHLALKESGVEGQIAASIDINTIANKVYAHNFPETKLLNRNIQGLTAKFINNLDVDTILMSPPCQPFTRNGLQKDTEDARTCSFTHLLSLLPDLCVKNLLIENVKGFETSEMRKRLIDALKANNYAKQEFILTPTQVGIPNTRHRYYCLAKKNANEFNSDILQTDLITTFDEPFEIADVLDDEANADFNIPEKILRKRAKILDICYKDSVRSCCFTKAYGRYVEGTGSVFSDKTANDVTRVYERLQSSPGDSDEFIDCISELNLRFFTPREICRLMAFPESFTFPADVSRKQRYNLLGNSINVKVVSVLIKILDCCRSFFYCCVKCVIVILYLH